MTRRGFTFITRSDQRTLIVLLLAALAVVALIYFVGGKGLPEGGVVTPAAADSTAWADSAARQQADNEYYTVPEKARERFTFDPNTADSTQLLRLGLQPRQVKNIYRYRARGGIFRRKEDFARVYGLTLGQYRSLEPYIKISDDFKPAADFVHTPPFGQDTTVYPKKIADTVRIELNAADSAQLRTVPGIGQHYTREILSYRKRLGGFVTTDQLDEIDFFPEEAKRFFFIDTSLIRKINVNKLTLNQLKQHPYINFYQARAITDYRRTDGPLTNIDQLRLLDCFNDSIRQRLRPYLEY